ncbi:ATP-binding cassette domain-containing protein [Salinicola sp. CPA57]|uniref:ATP-binding cassette domain-containing protein n=1 Tax=Salinicola sp. CPA57 TaxID=1949080 RepID=UPI000DA13C56|nr:ATP-binding cassette domain-containing protein [Salinicola sp. CPA57]
MTSQTPMIEMRHVGKRFGSVVALRDISMKVCSGEVMCLLGDNGAGKSTLIKTLSGVYKTTEGEMLVNGKPVRFRNPAAALDAGIATVFQDLAMIPLMSITRNFFMGREPIKGVWPFKRVDWKWADQVAMQEMARIGIDVRDPSQPVGTLSGGERQCVAIARAVYFGAKVLILDEPTSALGVKQASVVLRYVARARAEGLAVIFITHNVHHAYPVGDVFTLLKRGTSLGTFRKSEVTREQVLDMMAGGAEMASLDAELAEFQRSDQDHGRMDEAAGSTTPHRQSPSAQAHTVIDR